MNSPELRALAIALAVEARVLRAEEEKARRAWLRPCRRCGGSGWFSAIPPIHDADPELRQPGVRCLACRGRERPPVLPPGERDPSHEALLNRLHRRRTVDVRIEVRAVHIARAFLRGRPFQEAHRRFVERRWQTTSRDGTTREMNGDVPVGTAPPWTLVYFLVQQFGPTTAFSGLPLNNMAIKAGVDAWAAAAGTKGNDG